MFIDFKIKIRKNATIHTKTFQSHFVALYNTKDDATKTRKKRNSYIA